MVPECSIFYYFAKNFLLSTFIYFFKVLDLKVEYKFNNSQKNIAYLKKYIKLVIGIYNLLK